MSNVLYIKMREGTYIRGRRERGEREREREGEREREREYTLFICLLKKSIISLSETPKGIFPMYRRRDWRVSWFGGATVGCDINVRL